MIGGAREIAQLEITPSQQRVQFAQTWRRDVRTAAFQSTHVHQHSLNRFLGLACIQSELRLPRHRPQFIVHRGFITA